MLPHFRIIVIGLYSLVYLNKRFLSICCFNSLKSLWWQLRLTYARADQEAGGLCQARQVLEGDQQLANLAGP